MSLLIERFAGAKGSVAAAGAEDKIVQCVKRLRRTIGLHAVAPGRLEPFMASRNIRDLRTDDDLKADGALVPLGTDFRAGFRLILRRDLAESRINFTVAHEICHTFFYEWVPEIKFASHGTDLEEERLCNCGAEEILMPAWDVKRRAKSNPESLDGLLDLAAHYRVSASAMLIRLRGLDLWNAELVLWHEMTNGKFEVKRQWGGKLVDWQWLESEIPRTTLSAAPGLVMSGNTFWINETPQGRKFRPVCYQIKRYGNELLALLLKKKKSSKHVVPQQSDLFSRPRKRMGRL